MPSFTSSRPDARRAEKENFAPRNRSRDEGDNSFGDMSMDDDAPRKSGAVSKSSYKPSAKSGRGEGEGEASVSMSKRLAAVTAQRDQFSKQFEELSKLRLTDTEKLFDKYKQKAELQANTQNDLIANLTSLNEKLSSKISSLEKALSAAKAAAAGPPEEPRKVDPKEVRQLKDDLRKLQKDLQARDQKEVSDLEKELKTEVEHSRQLQSQKSQGNPLAASISTNPEEAEKDALSLSLYEEITGLGLVNVRIKPVKHGKETVFSCIQTVDSRSVSYKLRTYVVVNPDVAERKTKPWIKMVHYAPESLDKEIDQDLLSRLGLFRAELTVPFEQVGGLFDSLKSRISRDGIFDRLEGE